MSGPAARPGLATLPSGPIHAVGATGLETAAMIRYLIEGGRTDLIAHDLADDLAASFAIAHRLQPQDLTDRAWAALQRCADLRTGADYLRGVEDAAAVLVPAAWFLHARNDPLRVLADRFVTYPDACLAAWPGRTVGVTGTFAKSTTTAYVAALTDGVAVGNDREFTTDLAALERAGAGDVLAIELSNRHLATGLRHPLDVGVLTGIALNHEPDHGDFAAYRQVKYSLARHARHLLAHTAVLADWPEEMADLPVAETFGPGGDWQLAEGPGRACRVPPHGEACRVPPYGEACRVPPYGEACRVPPYGGACLVPPNGEACLGTPYGVLSVPTGAGSGPDPVDLDAAVAATAAAARVGVPAETALSRWDRLRAATPRYRHTPSWVGARCFGNDASACLPAAATALVRTLTRPTVLIAGGDRQRYRPGEFAALAAAIAANPAIERVLLIGPMAPHLAAELAARGRTGEVMPGLAEAFKAAVATPGRGGDGGEADGRPAPDVVFSPGCGTGADFVDLYERGEVFDGLVAALVPGRETRG